MIGKLTGAGVLLIALFFSSVSTALPTLDQYQDNYTGTISPLNTWKIAQTFTAGITGTLDSIQIGCSSTGVTTWEIWETTTGAPNGSVLGGVTASSDMTLGCNTIDMASKGITVNAGTMYAIVTYYSAGGHENLRAAFDPDSYTAGQLWLNTGSGWEVVTNFGGGDLQFRTYVEPSTIPAPGAVLLGSLGIGLVRLLRKKGTV